MANWKERGEVPDSEDELAFDSDDLELPLPHVGAAARCASSTSPAKTNDIWDLPASSRGESSAVDATDPARPSTPQRETCAEPESSPLSDPPSDLSSGSEGSPTPKRRKIHVVLYSRQISPDPLANDIDPPAVVTSKAKAQVVPTSQASAERQVRPDEDDDVFALPNSGTRNVTDDPVCVQVPPIPDEPVMPDERTIDEPVLGPTPSKPAFDPAPRVRTFRPRKPIQQHPYALENARYSSTFKSHGLKPLRFDGQFDSRPRARVEEEDSQEKEFVDDSQDTADDHLLVVSEESQEDAQLDDWHIHRSSPPSTPRTAVPPIPGGPSSLPGSSETRGTSVVEEGEEDEFPPLQELIKVPVPLTSSARSTKRKSLSDSSAQRKRLKAIQASDHQGDGTSNDDHLRAASTDSPSYKPHASHLPRLIFPDDISLSPPSPIAAREEPRVRSPSRSPSIVPHNPTAQHGAPIDLTAELDSASANESTDASSESEATDSEHIKKAARRLRGVLPPSYLRLNETEKNQARRALLSTRNDPGSTERLQRKGVAQYTRTGGGTPTVRFDVFEDSDNHSNETPVRINDSPTPMVQRTLVLESDDDYGDSSAMEDNRVDLMLPRQVRQTSRQPGEPGPVRKRRPSNRSPLEPTQPKITSLFQGSDVKSTPHAGQPGTKPKRRKPRTGQLKSSRSKAKRQKRGPVPRLGILDVIEPDAPQFLKVAARSARQHAGLGRTSPSKKIFQLATRWDHIDVNMVLQNWKGGRLKPRHLPDARPRKPAVKGGIQSVPRSGPAAIRPWPITKQRKLVKQIKTGGQVTYESTTAPTHPTSPSPSEKRPDRPLFRPAQLETTSTELAKYSFHAKKKALDNLWRRSRHDRESATASVVTSIRQIDRAQPSVSPPPEHRIRPAPQDSTDPIAPSPHQTQKSKFRKKFVPKALDISAPQFSAANEPLLRSTTPSVEDSAEAAAILPEANKLTGLSPFGTQYTHHFEIFPLDTDVFFHESTLLGSGRIDKATDNWDEERLARPRPRASFTLDGKPIRWGGWDDQVSSELGIMMDWISDHLQGDDGASGAAESAAALRAFDFVLGYVQDSMSLPDSTAELSFAHRMLETMKGFLERFQPSNNSRALGPETKTLDILCRLLVVVFTCNHICRKSAGLVDVRMSMEDLLVAVARVTTRVLLDYGIHDVLRFLEDSRQLSFRQRGIRPRHAVVHTWVVLMRVLEVASIPRLGFWDVAHSVLIPRNIDAETSFENMEKLWKTMFTLLPLREFDSQGVIVPGIRRLVSMDGWTLPQRLIKRVFGLYKQNDRQAAGFNNYCRSLIGRCHYLAREWGWSKCGGIIGTIFDFFGSQNLSHLRNEEAYKSPRFLEELASNPSLVVDREDRCFHIFLKFVALTIKRLADRKASNEIRNLITRLMPNHNRVYLKEQSLYSFDLASLRNHHDLLCTLFWAAPRDLRPGAHMIEALIKPGDTHKDACLVNLRAWNQLARYVVSSEDSDVVFEVFRRWQSNIFRQLMDQFETAASDAQQQYLALSAEDSQGITQTQIEFVVSVNKTTAKEIIHACVNASRDVLPYAHSIPAATFALNISQVEEILRHFSVSPPTLDWSTLRSALETVNAYMFKVDALIQRQLTRDASGADYLAAQTTTRLHRDLSPSLFSAARHIIGTEGADPKSAVAMVDKSMCVELIVVLAAKLFVDFSKAGLVHPSQVLGPGKHGVFGREVNKLPLGHRKYLVLFLAVLLKRGLSAVDALGPSLLEVWLLAIVKPRQFLAYENQLAEELKRRNEPFVPDAVVGLSINPDYGSNRDLFEYAISWMRQFLRDAPHESRKALVTAFSTALQTVMGQIKSDLRIVALDSVEHPNYVAFVRDIISLIRSHGTDMCAVDDFFHQMNKEYSPSLQDPRLHVAGIISYGLRLGEGDAKVVPQFFYYLYNSFKAALINDKLRDEAQMLRRGMRNDHVLAFVLGKMVPAIARAAASVRGVFPLLDVYHEALARLFTGPVAGRQITEEMLPHALLLVQTIVGCLCELGTPDAPLSAEQLHVAGRLCGIANVLWPSIQALSYTDRPSECLGVLEHLQGEVRAWLDAATSHLDIAVAQRDTIPRLSDVFSGLHGSTRLLPPAYGPAMMFTESIITDVHKNWVVSDSAITIQAPGRSRGPSSTQSGQGVKRAEWDVYELAGSLNEELKLWRYKQGETFPASCGGRRAALRGSATDGLIF